MENEEELARRFYLFGGIPRYIFSPHQADCKRKLDNALRRCNARDLIVQCGDHSVGDVEASHKIIMLDVKNYLSTQVKFVSEYVIEKFPEQLFAQCRADALVLVGVTLRNFPEAAGMRGNLFEPMAHDLLARGGSFALRDQDGNESTYELPLKIMTTFDATLKSITRDHLPPNRYLKPKSKSFTMFDSFEWRNDDWLVAFQMTVSRSKDFNMDSIDVLIEKVEAKGCELIYVVPEDIFPFFSLPEEKSEDGLVRIYVLSLKLVGEVLHKQLIPKSLLPSKKRQKTHKLDRISG